MATAHSKVTAQGQISVPAEIRKKLGIGPGSVLEWEEHSGQVVVRKAGRFSSEEVHVALFGNVKTIAKKPVDVKAGIQQYVRDKHARR